MVDTAKEISSIPDRDKFIRDGAYNMAIAGNWARAEEIAQEYLKSKKGKYKDDALYLVARSQEYQLKFGDAAKNYLSLATKYPRHSRAYVSLERAENLAATEEDFITAGKSAELLAKRTRESDKRYEVYMRSADHYIRAGEKSESVQHSRKC